MLGLSIDNCMHSWTLSPVPWSEIHDGGPDSVDGGRIKALIYMVKKICRQSTLIQGILRPQKIFLNGILSRLRNPMFS